MQIIKQTNQLEKVAFRINKVYDNGLTMILLGSSKDKETNKITNFRAMIFKQLKSGVESLAFKSFNEFKESGMEVGDFIYTSSDSFKEYNGDQLCTIKQINMMKKNSSKPKKTKKEGLEK